MITGIEPYIEDTSSAIHPVGVTTPAALAAFTLDAGAGGSVGFAELLESLGGGGGAGVLLVLGGGPVLVGLGSATVAAADA